MRDTSLGTVPSQRGVGPFITRAAALVVAALLLFSSIGIPQASPADPGATAEDRPGPVIAQGGPAAAPSGPLSLAPSPDDPFLPYQWGLRSDVGTDALDAWNRSAAIGAIGSPAPNVTVAVLDSGIQADHEDLPNTTAGYDALAGTQGAEDACGHGTHVAGIVGAHRDNGLGVAGLAAVDLLPIKVLDHDGVACQGDLGALADAIREAADRDADVISLSLGCPQPCYDAGVVDAVRYADARGTLIVAAAGNATGGPVYFPADQPEVLTVGALDIDGTWAAYSARGNQIDLLAPGTGIVSTYTNGTYMMMTGTSMAAPHVAGIAALALTAQPGLTNDELRDALTSTARDLDLPSDVQGHGAVDAGAVLAAVTAR